ncbi:hypothetical protein BUALT_Bualt16G0050500 [Buddleja alternifolia]|uniref:Serine aminopeptidase S33 domain-containing protein n=1 Tax=Buddleja alternifolia TaxID=168488 RepID=A0AAV6WJT2_9LAMI|nr:hypothetical protein BUALT_Bualt16G0050500 [Buddleja alternifolia]
MDQNPGMQQKIKIEKKDGEILVGMLHETGSNGIVIACHGFLCTKDQPIIVNLAMALKNAGISVFRFDFTGNGESDGSFQYGNYYKEVEDIRAVIEYFSGVNRKIIAILGHSKDLVVNVSGRYYLDRGIEVRLGANFMERIKNNGFIDFTNQGKVQRVTKESLMERLNINMHDTCLSIDKRCRVVTIHGSKDKVVQLEEAFEFKNVLTNHKIHIIKRANHGYVKHQAELASIVLFSIKELLHLSKNTMV